MKFFVVALCINLRIYLSILLALAFVLDVLLVPLIVFAKSGELTLPGAKAILLTLKPALLVGSVIAVLMAVIAYLRYLIHGEAKI